MLNKNASFLGSILHLFIAMPQKLDYKYLYRHVYLNNQLLPLTYEVLDNSDAQITYFNETEMTET